MVDTSIRQTPLAAYSAAHKAHVRARELEESGEAFELGENPGPVEAAEAAIVVAALMVAELDVPDTVRRAFETAQAAHQAAEAASLAAEDWTPESIEADDVAWDAFGDALGTLWLAVEAAQLAAQSSS